MHPFFLIYIHTYFLIKLSILYILGLKTVISSTYMLYLSHQDCLPLLELFEISNLIFITYIMSFYPIYGFLTNNLTAEVNIYN